MAFLFKKKKSASELIKSLKKHLEILSSEQQSLSGSHSRSGSSNSLTSSSSTNRLYEEFNTNSFATPTSSPTLSVAIAAAAVVSPSTAIMNHSLEKMTINLGGIKLMLYGDNETEPNEENNIKLCDLLFNTSTNTNTTPMPAGSPRNNSSAIDIPVDTSRSVLRSSGSSISLVNLQVNHASNSSSSGMPIDSNNLNHTQTAGHQHNLLLLLLLNIKKFEFEARKDVAQIFSYLLRHRKVQAVEYVRNHSDMLRLLVDGYNDTDIALNCGGILREIIRHEELASAILNNTILMNSFFELVQLNTFDIASDAFATFKLLLTKHKKVCADWLNSHFEVFCVKYSILLQAGNYVTKRQSLKLLGELLLNRANFNVMMLYINSPDNLKIMMNLLRGNTKAIQFEAFHVFKIFVANPRKSVAVTEILVRNKLKLIDFLHKFTKDRSQEDEELFAEEKITLIRTLEALQAPAGSDAVPAPLVEESHSSSSRGGGGGHSDSSNHLAGMVGSSSSNNLPQMMHAVSFASTPAVAAAASTPAVAASGINPAPASRPAITTPSTATTSATTATLTAEVKHSS